MSNFDDFRSAVEKVAADEGITSLGVFTRYINKLAEFYKDHYPTDFLYLLAHRQAEEEFKKDRRND